MTEVTYWRCLEVAGEEEGVTDEEAGVELSHVNTIEGTDGPEVPHVPGAGVDLRHIVTIEVMKWRGRVPWPDACDLVSGGICQPSKRKLTHRQEDVGDVIFIYIC